MKHLSFPRTGPSRDVAQTLECLVLDGRGDADRDWIKTKSGLEETVKQLVSTAPTHSGRSQLGSSIVLSLVRTEDANDDVLIGVNVVIEANRLVAVCYGTGLLVENELALYAGQEGGGGVSRLLPVVVTALVRPLQSKIARLAETIDDLEDKAMLEGDKSLDDAVVLVARRVLTLRHYLVPMRDELSFLALNPDELPGPAEPLYLRRAAEYPGRLVSALDSSHQRIALILNQLRTHNEDRLTRSVYKLAIVGTVFLPLTFFTGLLGINVAGIPDAHDPRAFWLVCGVLLVVAIGSIALIRWRKWL